MCDAHAVSDVKIAFFPDSITHSYDFCIKSIVPIMTAPNPVVATGNYGPTWNNQKPQAVNGINGYTVQSAPFPTNGNPMTMQVKATASDGSTVAANPEIDWTHEQPPEARRWFPHLTVLRFKERPRLAPPLPELAASARKASAQRS